MRWLQFILSHSIFIAVCASALCFQTFLLLHIPFNREVAGLVFFATLGSYNFYWLISKYYFSRNIPIKHFFVKHFSNLLLFFIAVLAMTYFIFRLPQLLPQIIVAVSLTLLYSIPLWPVKIFKFAHKAGFLKTSLLALTWTYVTVILPIQQINFVYSRAEILLFAARFFFMLMLCIIFDSRDIQVDKIHSLRSLATDVSRRSLKIIMAIAFTLYIASGFFLRYYFDNIQQVIAFLITGLITLFVYQLSLKKQGYIFYYFLVDGLMLFSALATYVASI